MHVRITIKSINAKSGMELGKTMYLHNDLSSKNSLLLDPIDSDFYEIMKIEQYSGFDSKNEEKIYVGDKVMATVLDTLNIDKTLGVVIGEVIWDMGAVSLRIDEIVEGKDIGYDIGSVPPLYCFESMELI